METNKLLKEEISRLFEIMNISGSEFTILTESFVDEAVSVAIKLFGKNLDSATLSAKLSSEYGVPRNAISTSKLDEFINIRTSDEIKKRIFSEIVSKMDTNGIFKLSRVIYDSNLKNIVANRIDELSDSIAKGDFTLANGKLDFSAVSKYIDEFIDKQIKITDTNFNEVGDRIRTLIDDEITKGIRAANVGPYKPQSIPITQQPLTPKITPKTDDITLDSIINKFLSDPLTYPDYPAFKGTVELIGFKDKITKMILANYKQFANFSPDQLINAGKEITANLNNKEWGWLKKLFVDVNTNKIKPKSVIKLVALVVTISVLVPWGYTTIEVSEKLRDGFKDFFGISGDGAMEYTNNEESLKKWASDNNITITTISWNEEYPEIDGILYRFKDESTGWIKI